MRIYILLIAFLLVGCTSTGSTTVLINENKVPAIQECKSVYVSVEALEGLNIHVQENEEKTEMYLVNENGVSNDRPFSWYIDQYNTGEHADANCGPSTAVMASKWQKGNFKITPEEARNETLPSGGWWYIDDIKDFFNENEVLYTEETYKEANDLIEHLNKGNILLLCIDTTHLRHILNRESFIGKFYDMDGGHFIIVKGYTYVEDELYFEVYDPNSWDQAYQNGTPKGLDRLYPATELDVAIKEWWDQYLVILDN